MPAFEYKAVTSTGKVVTDIIDAASVEGATRELFGKGYRPISVKAAKAKSTEETAGGGMFAKKIKLDELVLFTKELVTLLKAGVPMLTSLEALSEQSASQFGQILRSMNVSIMSGKSLSQAMDMHPKVFSKLYVNSVRAGELSGSLDEVLLRLVSVLKHDAETRKKVKGALKYPMFVISAMTIAFVVIMTQVVPNFMGMFASFNMELPLPTRMLIATSDFLQANFLYILIGVVGLGGGFFGYKRTARGQLWWDTTILKIPLIGNLVLKSTMARFTKMFETLNRSGLPIIQTMGTVAVAVGNKHIESIIKEVTVGIEKGQGIAGSMKKFPIFPPLVIRMIAIGEQSGSLDDMLDSVSQHFDMEVEYAVDGLTSMIEPIMTVAIAGAVAILAMGIFMPMWGMIGAI
ncbi:MAG TPA: type II secretion system F family protein [bacterium]|nr:type II secretion system F family protein [bacterium]